MSAAAAQFPSNVLGNTESTIAVNPLKETAIADLCGRISSAAAEIIRNYLAGSPVFIPAAPASTSSSAPYIEPATKEFEFAVFVALGGWPYDESCRLCGVEASTAEKWRAKLKTQGKAYYNHRVTYEFVAGILVASIINRLARPVPAVAANVALPSRLPRSGKAPETLPVSTTNFQFCC